MKVECHLYISYMKRTNSSCCFKLLIIASLCCVATQGSPLVSLLYISSVFVYFLTHCILTDTLPASKHYMKQTMAIQQHRKSNWLSYPSCMIQFKRTNWKHPKVLSPHLDMTSSQKEGNRTRRCGRLSLFSSIARPLFKTGCSGKADAVSGWIFRRANSWRIKIISSSLAAGKLRSPAETIREFKNTTFNVE